MTALQYIGTGTVLGILAGISLIVCLILWFGKSKRPLYTKRLRKVIFPAEFYQKLDRTYQQTEDILKTLELLREEYAKGSVATRLSAAIDYLQNSHYRDYETALYRYLSDHDTGSVLTKILLADIQKMKRLPCREEERN